MAGILTTQQWVLAIALAAACWPAAASAYVRTTTAKSGTPLRWMYSNCVHMRVNSRGLSTITDGSDLAAVKRAMENWRDATKHCSYMRFHLLPETEDARPHLDRCGVNENVIYFDEAWSHDPSSLALTLVMNLDLPGNTEDGRIIDMDIVVNAAAGSRLSASGEAGKHDIESILTHELGHLLGLDHPCDDGVSSSKRPIKNHKGVTIPVCGSPGETVEMQQSTMYVSTSWDQTHMRSPEADDINGVCAIYPIKDDPGTCQPVVYEQQDCGCSCGVGPAPGRPLLLPLVLLLALGLLAALRRSAGRKE